MQLRAAPPLAHAPSRRDDRSPEQDAWRAARRLLATSLSALESVGHLRLETRGLEGRDLAHARAERLRATMARLSVENGFEARISGAPWPEGPAVICVNHLSWIDIPVLLGLVPAVPVAKAEVAAWPVVGSHARALGVIFVNRGEAHSGAVALRAALRALDHGLPVLAFPEGTTTDGASPLLPFRRGLFGVARRAGVPVVPVAIRYRDPARVWCGDSYLLPHFLRTVAAPRTVIDVRVGAPIDPAAFPRAEELAAVARASVTRLLGSIS
jgi:1-acyl-sn-glycerol-3-phosphate acyltransferase